MAKLRPNQFLLPSGALITELPILFSTEMVRANLDGRKIQTRRIVKPELEEGKHTPWNHRESTTWQWQTGKAHINYKDDERRCPFGKPGDMLWAKEKFTPLGFDMVNQRTGLHYSYFADCNLESLDIAKEYGFKWKPSMFLPKEASRIWLMVEDIRVERVKEISEEDAIAEGIKTGRYGNEGNWKDGFYSPVGDNSPCMKASQAFELLWWHINGEESWNANPWVWVVKYRILSTTGRPSLEVIEGNYLEVTTVCTLPTEKEVSNG